MAIAGVEAKSAKGHEETATGGGFELFGDFATTRKGFEPMVFQQIAKPRICLRFCMGLVCNFRELSNSPSGFGVRNLTNVVDKPGTFI